MTRHLLAALDDLGGLSCEDPLGIGYLAAHICEDAEFDFGGFMTCQELQSRLRGGSSESLLLSCFTLDSPCLSAVLDTADSLDIPVMLGGPAFCLPACHPVLAHKSVRKVLFGEADAVPAEAIIGGGDCIPFPALWSKTMRLPRPALLRDPNSARLPWRVQLKAGRTSSARLLTSRGCPFNCRYCGLGSIQRTEDIGWRPRSFDSISHEIEFIRSMGAAHVSLADESVTGVVGALERMDGLASLFLNTNLTFSAMIAPGVLGDVSQNQADKWVAAGLRRVVLLLNSCSGLIAGRLESRIATLAGRLAAAGIEVESGLITVDPFTSPAQFLLRINSVAKLSPSCPESYVRSLRLVPGTSTESRVRRARFRWSGGPRALRNGIEFHFKYQETARLVESLLGFLDANSSLKGHSLSIGVEQWLAKQ